MKLIVGLGNPGKEYEKTRHNMGFMTIDTFANKYNFLFNKNKFDGVYAEGIIEGEKVILLKPQKYINLSGEVIRDFINYYKINIQDILVLCDDMDLEIGTFKIRYKGGSAGHNGLKNIEANLKTQEYKRVRIGISRDKNYDVVDYVLGKLSKEELAKSQIVLDKIPDIIYDFVTMSFDNLMNKYNS